MSTGTPPQREADWEPPRGEWADAAHGQPGPPVWAAECHAPSESMELVSLGSGRACWGRWDRAAVLLGLGPGGALRSPPRVGGGEAGGAKSARLTWGSLQQSQAGWPGPNLADTCRPACVLTWPLGPYALPHLSAPGPLGAAGTAGPSGPWASHPQSSRQALVYFRLIGRRAHISLARATCRVQTERHTPTTWSFLSLGVWGGSQGSTGWPEALRARSCPHPIPTLAAPAQVTRQLCPFSSCR